MGCTALQQCQMNYPSIDQFIFSVNCVVVVVVVIIVIINISNQGVDKTVTVYGAHCGSPTLGPPPKYPGCEAHPHNICQLVEATNTKAFIQRVNGECTCVCPKGSNYADGHCCENNLVWTDNRCKPPTGLYKDCHQVSPFFANQINTFPS